MTAFATSFTSTKWWWNSAKSIVTLLLALVAVLPAQSQVLQTGRYELPLLPQERHIETITAGKNGVFLYRTYFGQKDDVLQLIKIDTAFSEEWSGYLHIEKGYIIMGRQSFDGKLYLLLRYHTYAKNDLILLAIDERNGSYVRYHVPCFIPLLPSQFNITNNGALIGGYYNRVPVVLFFTFDTRTTKVLPGLFNEAGELAQVKTYNDGTFDVLISSKNFSRQRTMWIKNYDADGNLLRNLPLDPGDKHFIFGRAVRGVENTQIVAGVFGTVNAEYSKGLFITALNPDGESVTRLYHFSELENFFAYMKPRREERIKSRIERKLARGKHARFSYRFLVHELIPYQGNYILLGEAFVPQYRYPRAANYGSTPARIFDGYLYTHAVVMCFDKTGNLLWDNSFEINDIKTFTLDQFVKIEPFDDKIALIYMYDNTIRTKVIQSDKVVEGKTIDPIQIFSDTEVVKRDLSDHGRLEYWYGDSLLACGIQEIAGKPGVGASRRTVFYINKIRFADHSED